MAHEAETIDPIIARLSAIVDQAKVDGSRHGYFAALYRKVTVQVQQGVAEGFFDDGERMARLDVIFAQRYLDAFDAYRNGGTPSRSWLVAFQATEQWWPIVLQHLLLGMNAHINLDLGIAAAQSVPAERLADLRDDFDKINTVLTALVGGVQDELAQVWRTLRLLDALLGGADEALVNFSMEKARDHAWAVAERMAPLNEAERERAIAELDRETLPLAHLIRSPGIVGGTVTKIIRLGERGTIRQTIDLLA
jgi:hypothetical protein